MKDRNDSQKILSTFKSFKKELKELRCDVEVMFGEDNRIIVEDDLNLRDTNIKILPEGLIVRGNLTLRNSLIEELPKDLYVEGNVDLMITGLEKLPENMQITGDLFLAFSNIKALPNDLYVGGNLYSNDLIKEIPEGCIIEGEVYDEFGMEMFDEILNEEDENIEDEEEF